MSTQPMDRYFPEWSTADRLRRIRRESGLTQGAFAERLQITPQRYAAWESGRNQPPLEDFKAFAARVELAFGVAREWTLGLADRAERPDGPGGGSGRFVTERQTRLLAVAA